MAACNKAHTNSAWFLEREPRRREFYSQNTKWSSFTLFMFELYVLDIRCGELNATGYLLYSYSASCAPTSSDSSPSISQAVSLPYLPCPDSHHRLGHIDPSTQPSGLGILHACSQTAEFIHFIWDGSTTRDADWPIDVVGEALFETILTETCANGLRNALRTLSTCPTSIARLPTDKFLRTI